MLQRKFPAANFLLGLFYRHGSRKFTEWMSHRKQKDTKQQPGTAGTGNLLVCCLVSLCFLCDISVYLNKKCYMSYYYAYAFILVFSVKCKQHH